MSKQTFPVRGDGQYPTAQTYLATRAHNPRVPARDVLAAIRGKLDRPKLRQYPPSGAYNPRIARKLGYSQTEYLTAERWVESTDRAGLRFVGHADEIVGRSRGGIDHQGWYLDGDFPDESEVYRGAVWQLPSRDGRAVYVAGYCDPFNDGAALIDFSPIIGEPGGSGAYGEHEQAARDAARAGDSMAQRDAETEREYRAKSNARQRVESLREQIKAARDEHSAIAAELRVASPQVDGQSYPALCRALRAALKQERLAVSRAVREIRDTLNEYGDEILTEEYA